MKKNPEVLLQKIKDLGDQGFTRVHIPGGTSKNGEHYAGVFLYFYDEETKQLFFLGVPYCPNFYKNCEENGHTKKKGETPKQTAHREVFEETGLVVDENNLKIALNFSVPSRTDSSKEHLKYFYYTDSFTGNLHDFEGPNPIDGETTAPIWIPAKLFKQVLFKGHQQAFVETMKRLAEMSADCYYALIGLL